MAGKTELAENEVSVEFGQDLVGIISGASHSTPKRSVIITHGAGQGMESRLLTQTAQELAKRNYVVLRFNFAYMTRKSAPSAGGKKELPDLLAAIDFMKSGAGSLNKAVAPKPILIGKSFGARVIANAAVANPDLCAALVFYGLPLQGMSKTSKPRDWSHLSKITMPILFITGDKDKLCPLGQLDEVTSTIKSPITLEIVSGDHSYKPRSEAEAVRLCVDWIEHLQSKRN